nr:hypothetical protein [Tanacetum cinerariifolium]
MDKIICDLNKTPTLSQRPPQNFPKCGSPVDCHYCQGCALLRKKFKEDLFTSCIENGILHYFQETSEPSNDNTNVVNALQELFVVKQEPGKNSSQSPPQINHHCCYGCGDLLEDIFCHQCTCELCGKGAYYCYNCPPKVLVVSNPEPCHNQNVDELPQTVLSFDPTYYSENENSFTYDSKSNLVDDSPDVFDPPLQPSTYSYEFCGNDAYYGHDCLLQVPFNYDPKPHEFIKSSAENLILNPSEFEGEYRCDVPACEYFTTFSNILFDVDYDFSSSDDQSFYDEDIPKEIYSNPLFDEEIIYIKIDPHHFNAESDLIESLLNHDSLIISSSLKIGSLFDEFTSELTLLKLIPLGINETDCDLEEETRLIKRLFNDFLSLPKNDSFHFDIPSSSRPPAKPPDDNSGILNVKVNGTLLSWIFHFSISIPLDKLKYGGIGSSFATLNKRFPGHLAARLGCAETKVITWDDLAFKLITLGWNVKHENFAKSLIQGKDIKEKDKIRAKNGQNQEQTKSVEKSKVKPDEIKS